MDTKLNTALSSCSGSGDRIALLAKVDSDGDPNVFNVEHDSNGRWLNSNYGNPDNHWNSDNRWVFCRNSFHYSPLRICQEW